MIEGDIPAGDAGLAGDPNRVNEFRENVPLALSLARALDCRKLNALPGNRSNSGTKEQHMAVLVDNIRFAADLAARQDATILLEPINSSEYPRYLLPSTTSVIELIRAIERANVKCQFDIYHSAMAGEDVAEALEAASGVIGHVQLGDVPGRHEPGTGDLPLVQLVRKVREVGYTGSIGLEYWPSAAGSQRFEFLEWLDVDSRSDIASEEAGRG
jgi:hydroxypyruvate isomerase